MRGAAGRRLADVLAGGRVAGIEVLMAGETIWTNNPARLGAELRRLGLAFSTASGGGLSSGAMVQLIR